MRRIYSAEAPHPRLSGSRLAGWLCAFRRAGLAAWLRNNSHWHRVYRALRVAPGHAERIGEISDSIGQIVSGSSNPLAAPV